jgi:ATP-dependent helicase Lhr and Lhr-like helicase
LTRLSPLAVPVMLDIGRESVGGEARESLLMASADDLIAGAMHADGSSAGR